MHLLWQILDEKHPDYNPEVIRNFENTFLELYSTIDSWISKFMESIPDATFLIFSLSGMEPNYSGWHLLPEVLQRMGMIGDAPKSTNGGFGSRIFKNFEWLMPTKKWGTHKIRKLEDSLSLNVIEIAKQIIPRRIWDKLTRRVLYAGNNWRWSRAFCIPNDYTGAIRINLKGREPNGIVEPGREYDDLCDELVSEIDNLVNPDTGKRMVSEVLRISEALQWREYMGSSRPHCKMGGVMRRLESCILPASVRLEEKIPRGEPEHIDLMAFS